MGQSLDMFHSSKTSYAITWLVGLVSPLTMRRTYICKVHTLRVGLVPQSTVVGLKTKNLLANEEDGRVGPELEVRLTYCGKYCEVGRFGDLACNL